MAANIERLAGLHYRYRDGRIHVNVPEALFETDGPIDELIKDHLPASAAALEAASRNLFCSLPVAFDPASFDWSVPGHRRSRPAGQPYRFLDMGALIATQAFGENDPTVVEAMLNHLPYAVSRYAHSEYQTAVSLRLKAELDRIAPRRHAAPLRGQHRRRGGGERDQVGAAESREDSRANRTAASSFRSRARSTAARSAASP